MLFITSRLVNELDSFGRIIETFVTVILLFIVPIQWMAYQQDLICETVLMTETAYFVDAVRNTGILDQNMYQTYMKKLQSTHHIYDMEMIHYHTVFIPNEEEDTYRKEYECTYQTELLDLLNKQGQYYFSEGDFFVVIVKNQDQTMAEKFQETLLGRLILKQPLQVRYGGAIRNEV